MLPVFAGSSWKAPSWWIFLQIRKKTYEAVASSGNRHGYPGYVWNSSGREAGECDRGGSAKGTEKLCRGAAQVPPMYSALKVNGKKLYELAREGKTVERKSPAGVLYEIEPLNFIFHW